MYIYYSHSSIDLKDNPFYHRLENNNNYIEIFQNYFSQVREEGTLFLPNLVRNNIFKPLISTTERVVDMVMSVK